MSMRVLILCENEYEDLELWYPKLRLAEAGAEVTVAGPKAGESMTGKHGIECTADVAFDDVDTSNYDALFVVGGRAPDKMRRQPRVQEILRDFDLNRKPIGLICHAAEVAVDAQILEGRKVTGHESIMNEVVDAGGIWRDEAVVIDGNMISSRTPADLPVFGKELVQHFMQREAIASASHD